MAIIKLGEIAKINMCKRVLAKETSKYGEVPFYKIGTLGKKSDSFITKELFNYLKNNYKYPELGDTLISCSGTIGKIIEFKGEDSYFQDSNIVWLSTSKLLKKYIFYWLSKNPFMATQGATIKRLYNSNIEHTYIFVPSLKEQQQIIDIIEPIENVERKILNIKNKLIKLLVTLYNNSKTKEQISFQSIIKTLSSSYEGQTKYFATNAIGEFEINYEKIIFLSNKIPSRAKISPITNSFIFSKLKGENKLLYFKEKPKEVFSTGFFNFQTNFQDHILGFMLSNDFKNQKEYLSIGTTMQGLNNSSLEIIKLNQPKHQSSIIAEILSDLEKNLILIKKLKSKLINLLIK